MSTSNQCQGQIKVILRREIRGWFAFESNTFLYDNTYLQESSILILDMRNVLLKGWYMPDYTIGCHKHVNLQHKRMKCVQEQNQSFLRATSLCNEVRPHCFCTCF